MTRLLHGMEGTPAHQRLLQLGAVDRVLSLHGQGYDGLTLRERLPSPFRGAIHVFDVPGSVPRTYVVSRARRAEGTAAVAAILADDFQMHDEVVLSTEPLADPATGHCRGVVGGGSRRGREGRAVSCPGAPTSSASKRMRRRTVTSSSSTPTTRSGEPRSTAAPAPIVRANVAFRAVALTRGHHTVDFRYRPRPVTWGLAISALTLAGLLAALAGFPYPRPAAGQSPP